MVERGQPGQGYFPDFDQVVFARATRAVKQALSPPKSVTHLGLGKADVKGVASNRRVLGADGKVRHIRWSKTLDPAARAAPEGIIDPSVRVISLWNGDQLVTVLSYYATHPQSHYGKGGVSCDFVGIARRLRDEAQPGVFFVHFNGAAGNVTAGKYNDGSPENRPVLSRRLADGMAAAQADSAAHKTPISAADVSWRLLPVALPVAPWIAEKELAKAFGRIPHSRRPATWPGLLQAPGSDDRLDGAAARPCPHPAHARRAFRGVSAVRSKTAARPLRGDGRLWRLRARLHRHAIGLLARRLRDGHAITRRALKSKTF